MKRGKYLLIVLIVSLVLVGCQAQAISPTATPASTPVSKSDSYALIRQARDAYRAAQFDKALVLARQAATLDPDNETAWELYRLEGGYAAYVEWLKHNPTPTPGPTPTPAPEEPDYGC